MRRRRAQKGCSFRFQVSTLDAHASDGEEGPQDLCPRPPAPAATWRGVSGRAAGERELLARGYSRALLGAGQAECRGQEGRVIRQEAVAGAALGRDGLAEGSRRAGSASLQDWQRSAPSHRPSRPLISQLRPIRRSQALGSATSGPMSYKRSPPPTYLPSCRRGASDERAEALGLCRRAPEGQHGRDTRFSNGWSGVGGGWGLNLTPSGGTFGRLTASGPLSGGPPARLTHHAVDDTGHAEDEREMLMLLWQSACRL